MLEGKEDKGASDKRHWVTGAGKYMGAGRHIQAVKKNRPQGIWPVACRLCIWVLFFVFCCCFLRICANTITFCTAQVLFLFL